MLSLKDLTGENQLLHNSTDTELRRSYVTGSSQSINRGLQSPAAQRAVRHRGSTCMQIWAWGTLLPHPEEPRSLGEARLQWDIAHMLLPAYGMDCTGCDKQQPLLQSPQCPCWSGTQKATSSLPTGFGCSTSTQRNLKSKSLLQTPSHSICTVFLYTC